MVGKSVFPDLQRFPTSDCKFCVWRLQKANFFSKEHQLISMGIHEDNIADAYSVTLDLYDACFLRGNHKNCKSCGGFKRIESFPTRFDAHWQFTSSRTDEYLHYIVHFPNCNVGFILFDEPKKPACTEHRSLRNPKYAKLLDEIFRQSEFCDFVRFIVRTTLGFILVEHSLGVINLDHLLEKIVTQFERMHKIIERLIRENVEPVSDYYSDIFRRQLSLEMNTVYNMLANYRTVNQLIDFAVCNRLNPEFNLASHYVFYDFNKKKQATISKVAWVRK